MGTTGEREVSSQTLGLERERGHVVVVLVLREAEPGARGGRATLPFDRSAPLTWNATSVPASPGDSSR